jgi:hypothetical protein
MNLTIQPKAMLGDNFSVINYSVFFYVTTQNRVVTLFTQLQHGASDLEINLSPQRITTRITWAVNVTRITLGSAFYIVLIVVE